MMKGGSNDAGRGVSRRPTVTAPSSVAATSDSSRTGTARRTKETTTTTPCSSSSSAPSRGSEPEPPTGEYRVIAINEGRLSTSSETTGTTFRGSASDLLAYFERRNRPTTFPGWVSSISTSELSPPVVRAGRRSWRSCSRDSRIERLWEPCAGCLARPSTATHERTRQLSETLCSARGSRNGSGVTLDLVRLRRQPPHHDARSSLCTRMDSVTATVLATRSYVS